MDDYWHIHGFDWLGELSPEESERLRQQSVQKRYVPGELVFGPVAQPHSVYLLEHGLVRIYRMSMAGTEATFGFVRPGEIFGELAAFTDSSRDSYAQAASASIAWCLPVEVVRKAFAQHPGIAFAVTKQIGNRLKRIESRVENLMFRDARARVAGILLELAEDFGREQDGARLIDLRLSQQELATLVGTTRQTANAVLRDLEQAGVLRRHDGRVAVVRADVLLAHSQPLS